MNRTIVLTTSALLAACAGEEDVQSVTQSLQPGDLTATEASEEQCPAGGTVVLLKNEPVFTVCNGEDGAPGADGIPGALGPQGPAGRVGEAGPSGSEGAPGAAGPQGADGAAGPAGPQGPAGEVGSPGPVGEEGPAGPQGATGPQGPPGPEGPAESEEPIEALPPVLASCDTRDIAGQCHEYVGVDFSAAGLAQEEQSCQGAWAEGEACPGEGFVAACTGNEGATTGLDLRIRQSFYPPNTPQVAAVLCMVNGGALE